MSSDESPPVPKKQSQSKPAKPKGRGSAPEKVDALPKRRSYDVTLPSFLVKGLLEKNRVPLALNELQLKILIRDKD
jgi:hypothetical protein